MKTRLPIAAATTNKAFGCFLRAGIHRKAKQLHRLPTVPKMITLVPTVSIIIFATCTRKRAVATSEDILK
jgi:hypothetical protein